MKHTLGPWNFTPSTAGGTVMAKVQCGDNTTFSVSSHRSDGQADANARLVAAAPEMLQMLKIARMAIEAELDQYSCKESSPWHLVDTLENIESTIAKATGGDE
jgi:hypothetical protein